MARADAGAVPAGAAGAGSVVAAGAALPGSVVAAGGGVRAEGGVRTEGVLGAEGEVGHEGEVDRLDPAWRAVPGAGASAGAGAGAGAGADASAGADSDWLPAAGRRSARGGRTVRGFRAVRTPVLFLVCCGVLLVSLVVSVRIGAAEVGYGDLARSALSRLGVERDGAAVPRLLDSLVWDLRVPRVLLAALVGASLAVCGAVLQAVTRNALADPYLLGVSSGASAGAVVVVVLGFGARTLGVTGGAFVGALLSFGLLMLLLRRTGLDSVRIVLTGVVVAQLFAALTSLVLMASGDADVIRAITQWLLGSMVSARWDAVLVCAVVTAVGGAVVWAGSASLDGFSFGTDTASSLGVDVRRTRWVLLVVTSLMAAVAVASVGAIGFVGLIVPHVVRFLVGPLHRVLLPFSAVAGAVFLVWTDALARVAFAPQEVPVGVFTALLGVPLFLLVLRRRGEL